MTTTTQLRDWWAPACEGDRAKVALFGAGVVTVRVEVVPAVHALSACLEAWGYRTREADTGGYNCRRITGGTDYSLHAYGTAIDINWQSNQYGPTLVTDMPGGMVQAIKALRTRNGRQVWRWGGNYAGNRDAMHFEITCSPTDLATGLDPRSFPSQPTAPDEEDEMAQPPMSHWRDPDTKKVYRVDASATKRTHIDTPEWKVDEALLRLGGFDPKINVATKPTSSGDFDFCTWLRGIPEG